MNEAVLTTQHPIPTYTGGVDGADLGMTLIHEHVFVGDPELDRSLPHPEWDEQAAIERAVMGLTRLYELGVRTVVDLTVPGLGRNVEPVRRVAERVPVHLVAATGYYTSDVLPHFFHLNGPGLLVEGPDPLVDLFVGDLTRGIQGTGIRAGMIKIASDAAGITPDVEHVFTAASIAQNETGAPITTHSHAASRGGIEQQRMLSARGVPLDRIVIGHSGDSTDIDYLRELADNGSFLGFDRFGMAHTGDDGDRMRMLCELLELGYGDRIVLSQDAAFFSRITPPSWRAEHAPRWQMDHLSRRVLPELRERGVDDDTLRHLMVENPRRALAGR